MMFLLQQQVKKKEEKKRQQKLLRAKKAKSRPADAAPGWFPLVLTRITTDTLGLKALTQISPGTDHF